MAKKLIKVTESDFKNRDHFIKVQCIAYLLGLQKNQLKDWDGFQIHYGGTCENVLKDSLRKV